MILNHCLVLLTAEARDKWTSKQDIIQVFGLRKVYKLAGARRWWQFRRRRQPAKKKQPEKKQYVAVVDSWFGVPKGQLLCLLGPNGAGKTTSINCLIGECAKYPSSHASTMAAVPVAAAAAASWVFSSACQAVCKCLIQKRTSCSATVTC